MAEPKWLTALVAMLERQRRGFLNRHVARLRLLRSNPVPVFYDPHYRLPLPSIEAARGVEPRRADFVAWYLLMREVISPSELRVPGRVVYSELSLVHTPQLLEALGRKETLASVYAVDPSDLPVDETLSSVRLAAGGTVAAARLALKRRGPVVNLLGGFHHAFPEKAGGMCPVNDLAIALAVARAEGFTGQAVIIDLDAHPPDGTAACLSGDARAWIGSLSGSRWVELPPEVDETVLPEGCPDERYLEALSGMLSRMPYPDLAFVIAGGDVLAGDRMGRLGLTLDGARRRDLMVAEALGEVPSVWVPGGGYHRDAWKILAGTVLALTRHTRARIPRHFDPLEARYAQIWETFGTEQLGSEPFLTDADLDESLLRTGAGTRLLLGFFSAEGIEFALHQVGILGHLQRLGYRNFHVETSAANPGDRLRLIGESDGVEHVLVEAVLERRKIDSADALYMHWLELRNPKAQFSERRPQLPGQSMPGLGLAREAGEFVLHMARKMGMQALTYRPAWYHMAYTARYHFQFVDPVQQGRFEAMMRDLGALPLREVTVAFSEGRVRCNGEPCPWEPAEMVHWISGRRVDRKAVEHERVRVRYEIVPGQSDERA